MTSALDILNDRLLQAAELIGDQVAGNAREICPVDEGRLKNSIDYTVEDSDNEINIYVGTAVEYAPYLEFGTGIYAESGQGRKTPWAYMYKGNAGSRGWRTTRGQKSQAYLRPALYKSKEIIEGILSRVKL